MDGERKHLPVDTLAALDQLQAEVTELAHMARDHMAGPCGIANPCCPGIEVMSQAYMSGAGHVFDLLMVAICRVARQEAPRGDDPRD